MTKRGQEKNKADKDHWIAPVIVLVVVMTFVALLLTQGYDPGWALGCAGGAAFLAIEIVRRLRRDS